MEQNPSFGIGSPLLGSTSALAQAIKNHAPGGSLNQVTPGSPNFDGALNAPMPPQMPQGSPMSGMPQQAPVAPTQQPIAQPVPQPSMEQTAFSPAPIAAAISPNSPGGQQVTPTEAEKIIDVLSDRMKHLAKRDMVDRGVV